MKDIVYVGLGYIGLPSAVVAANSGFNVLGVDVDLNIVSSVNDGKTHISEPDLNEALQESLDSGRLRASVCPDLADVFVVVVPTPFDSEMMPDISLVKAATKAVIPFLKEGDLFIIESTCPVGTTEKIAELIFSERPELEKELSIAYCPERVLPGNILFELIHNDRVIGGLTPKASAHAKQFYLEFVTGEIYLANARTAELCKLAENSFRDVGIAFANELSIISHDAGIDIWELINLANRHPRVNILNPGCGVGGHCIAVDPWFLISTNREQAQLIKTARIRNDVKSDWCIQQAKIAIDEFDQVSLGRPLRVACMGLAFKPDVDDLRQSPALKIGTAIAKIEGIDTLMVEPNVESIPDFILTESNEAYELADIVIWLVDHSDFRALKKDPSKAEIDFCGMRAGDCQ